MGLTTGSDLPSNCLPNRDNSDRMRDRKLRWDEDSPNVAATVYGSHMSHVKDCTMTASEPESSALFPYPFRIQEPNMMALMLGQKGASRAVSVWCLSPFSHLVQSSPNVIDASGWGVQNVGQHTWPSLSLPRWEALVF